MASDCESGRSGTWSGRCGAPTAASPSCGGRSCVLRGLLPAAFAVAMGVAGGRGERRRPAGRPAGVHGRRVRAAPGAHAAAPGGRLQPRRPHRGVALRRAHRRLHRAAGHRPPRGPGARQRPHRGARVRPRHDRAAAVDLDGLHRRRPGRDGRRPGVGGRAVRASPGGRRSCWPAAGWPPTGCCGRARCGATATPTRCAAPSATPTTPTGSPSTRRPPRSCGCSGWPAGRSTASSTAAPRLHRLQYEATRLREKSVASSLRASCWSPTGSCSGR